MFYQLVCGSVSCPARVCDGARGGGKGNKRLRKAEEAEEAEMQSCRDAENTAAATNYSLWSSSRARLLSRNLSAVLRCLTGTCWWVGAFLTSPSLHCVAATGARDWSGGQRLDKWHASALSCELQSDYLGCLWPARASLSAAAILCWPSAGPRLAGVGCLAAWPTCIAVPQAGRGGELFDRRTAQCERRE